ncbi:MAG: hypothetical protein LUC85_07255 [Bacteroidales bacterium]|nr:hypothetical protein [Bacteroidales bacterium]MCD8394617.1 hypothetical protein [Bacteroidales bacterium]
MYSLAIDQFERVAELRFPTLIDPALRKTEESHPTHIVTQYIIDRPRTIEGLKEELREQLTLIFLYHWRPTRAVEAGQSLCYFGKPSGQLMYKLNFVANYAGKVDEVSVTVFDSIELLRSALIKELDHIAGLGGDLRRRSEKDFRIDFF